MPLMNMADDVERQSAQFPIDNIALKKLCMLLKNKADKVLNGKASFTLTTEVLNGLNEDCRRHSIAQSRSEEAPPGGPELNSWRPLRRVMANMKKSDYKMEQEEEWRNDIQFVKDFMLSTPNLKIIHKHGTLSFPISLRRFGNLSVLEIRKVPVHLIEGLQAIRGTLASLSIDRSLSNLKDLLESCGSDRSAPLTWARLKVLSLVFNDIRDLDDSLRLISHLERLDLSHNCIDATGKSLENLVDVLSVTLAYNRLTSIPSFSMTTRASLSSLFLRGNQLDNVQGVEVLSSLETLDLGENYIVDHFVLSPVKALHRLQRLYLDLNPLFYHKQHRRLTICHLSSRAVSTQFLLDNKRLSGSEVLAFNPHIVMKTSPRMWDGRDVEDRMSSTSPFQPNRPLSVSSGIGTLDNSPELIATSTPKKSGKRKRLKARNTEIRDLDASGEFSSSVDVTPGGSPSLRGLDKQMKLRREEALKTQMEVEKLREDYGPNWLQAMQDRNLFKQVPSVMSDSATETESEGRSSKQRKARSLFTDTEDETKNDSRTTLSDRCESEINGKDVEFEEESLRSGRTPTHDDLYLTDTNIDPVSNPIMAAIAQLASGHNVEKNPEGDGTQSSSIHTLESGRGEVASGKDKNAVSGEPTVEEQKSAQDVSGSTNDILGTVHKGTGKDNDRESRISNEPVPTKDTAALHLQIDGRKIHTSPGQIYTSPIKKLDGDEKAGREGTQPMMSPVTDHSTDRSTSEVDSSTDNSLQVSESEHESDPIFVTLPETNDTMIIVTFTELFILEKDVRGKVKEKLDIRSLVTMSVKKMKKKKSSDTLTEGQGDKDVEEGENSPAMLRMVLKFSYVKKDRQRRCYLMDEQDGETLRKHLQPFLDAKEVEAKKKDTVIMQCLKCNRSFQKKDVVRRSKQLPTSGSSKDLKVLQELIDTPTLMCPRCGSTILIEIESTLPIYASTAGSTTSTPSGSYSSTGSYMDNRHQLMQQQQQQQQTSPQQPRKPAPLLRNRSFDHQSPQAGLAARVARSRKFSLTSADNLPFHRRGNPALSSSPAIQSRSGSLTESRDRSNAFTATGQGKKVTNTSGSFTKEPTSPVDEVEELLHIEDHFAEDTMTPVSSSHQLALMTSSLREDSSSRGTKASSVRRNEERGAVMTGGALKDGMSDSGFESGVYSSSPRQQPEHTMAGEEMEQNSSDNKEKCDKNNKTVDEKKEETDIAGDNREKRKEKLDKENGEGGKSRSGSRISAEHKNLTAMEDLVNSLVNEGKNLEEEEMQKKAETESIHSLYDDRKKNISVSELRRFVPVMSSAHRNSGGSVDSDILPLNASPSGSSIATLNNPLNEGGEFEGDISKRGVSSPRFVIGSFENSHEELLTCMSAGDVEGEVVEGMSSPLSSSICNSMVSSMYENVTETGTEGNGEKSSHASLGPKLSVESAGSEISRLDEDEEEEDVMSIYDRPKQLKSIKGKSKKTKKHKQGQRDDDKFIEDVEEEEDKRSLAYSNILDQIHKGDNFHERQGSQSSFTDQVDGKPELMENVYGSPGVATHAEYGYDDGSDDGDDENDEDEEENFVDGGTAGSEVTYRFDRLDHRLTLYLMMSLFENQEEFLCKISCECVAYIMEEAYQCLLVMSSNRFYVLKVAEHDSSEEPAKWLSCIEVQPIPELRYIDVGLGGQSLRLEFVTDCSSYTLVTRNRNKTLQFLEVLHNHLAHHAVSHGIISNLVVNEDVDQMTVDNLDKDVLSKVIPDQTLLLYVMGFIERGFYKKFPVSFVVSPSEVCLVRSNHQWPQPRLQAPISVDTVGKQFMVLERQRINNIASVEVCELTLKRLRLELFNETEGISTVWNITMVTKQGTYDFIHAISEPWAREFGVDMDVSYSVLDFGK